MLRRLRLHGSASFLPILRMLWLYRRTRLLRTARLRHWGGLYRRCRRKSLFDHGSRRRGLWNNAVFDGGLTALHVALTAVFRQRCSRRADTGVLRDHGGTLLARLKLLTGHHRVRVLPHARLRDVCIRRYRSDSSSGSTFTHDLRHCHYRVGVDSTT